MFHLKSIFLKIIIIIIIEFNYDKHVTFLFFKKKIYIINIYNDKIIIEKIKKK